jgi:hypothetical protein
MTEMTSTATVVDERARFRAFTALGLALSGLAGGGVFASASQWLVMKATNDNGNEQLYFTGLAVGPLVMGGVALWLAISAQSTGDALARPLGRASVVLAVLSVVGAILLATVTYDSM